MAFYGPGVGMAGGPSWGIFLALIAGALAVLAAGYSRRLIHCWRASRRASQALLTLPAPSDSDAGSSVRQLRNGFRQRCRIRQPGWHMWPVRGCMHRAT